MEYKRDKMLYAEVTLERLINTGGGKDIWT
jgi:hypothetical protein